MMSLRDKLTKQMSAWFLEPEKQEEKKQIITGLPN